MGGFMDVGDVSFVVLIIWMGVIIVFKGMLWYFWVVVVCGGMLIGYKGMVYVVKVFFMIMVDFFEDLELREKVKVEFKECKGDYVYKGMVFLGLLLINSEC